MKIEPYLFFDGRSEEALEFYQQALGAQLEAKMRFSEVPDIPTECRPAGGAEKILHASLLVDGQRLMLSDGPPIDGGGFRGFSLTLQYPTDTEARAVFERLSQDGKVSMPLGPTFFSPCYGQLTDRFGVSWMVMVAPPAATQT